MIDQKNHSITDLFRSAPGETSIYLREAVKIAEDKGYDSQSETGATIVAGLVQASALQFLAYVVASNTNGLESAIQEISMVTSEAWQ